MKNKSVTYLITVEYEDSSGSPVTSCDFVTLTDESDARDVKDKIREGYYLPAYTPLKIISMCPMLHLDLEV